MIRPEVLSPAGDMTRLEAALRYGADAVYIGSTQFGMRAAPKNFDVESLSMASELCHRNGSKLYLTVNTLPRCDETPHLPEFLKSSYEAGVDALIIADIGVMMMARRLIPDMEIHASTQTGIFNELSANALGDLGIKRVVLARELSLDEIKTIRERTSPEIELEAFVHGAMCMSVSGRCTISNYLVGRDANRGACSQPCRWNYYLMEEKRPGLYIPIVEGERGTSILSAKDLCMIEHLRELYDAGVTSFKIEGRAKTAYYTAVVTNAYRVAVDAMMNNEPTPQWAVDELSAISHREYSTGFYYGQDYCQQTYHPGSYIWEWEIAAVVKNSDGNRLTVIERNRFYEGDELELLEPGMPPRKIKVRDLKNEAGESIEVINHPNSVVSMEWSENAAAGSILRRRKQE